MTIRIVAILSGLIVTTAAGTQAQDRAWVAEVTIGYAGFVDDAAKGYLLTGGGIRRYVTPRISIGGELTHMGNADHVRDRNVMLTGNLILDFYAENRSRRVTPFVVGGVGRFWGRDIVRGGPYWSSDPAFTAGGGMRVRITDSVSAAAEYRIGWELHQRVSATAGLCW